MAAVRRCALLLGVLHMSRGAPRTAENERWNVNLETRHAPDEYYGGWPGHTYHPSPADWRALPIYQLLTDRFADGDPTNNEAFASGFDVRDMTYRHGGDFAGLRQKLSYIKGLGCQAIWISPIFQNGDNMYHQYAQHDFTLLDRRLGTVEELRNLTSYAHELGMYVLIDVVMNHMDNEFFFEGHTESTAPFRWHEDDGDREYKLIPRRSDDKMYDTPAGRQPYADFWYNNTWDPRAQYEGRIYGQWGESDVDRGFGTYPGSDFHHNGDLQDYFKPWEINMGKIYGTMDDLRLENPRVQQKYIAMTKALIASTDVDGFRVDTPMQVPLAFFKAWAPAVREFAKTLGKDRFAMFGEFFVKPERYATMTGRGRDNTMYGKEQFIEGGSTLKGGIVYSYYWYTFTAMVYERPALADGLPLAYNKEGAMLDTFDPSTNRTEYAMWNFCNNHDNWRLQVMTGNAQMRMCLTVITFWPGVPLHYAGDEQDFNSPGSALDGWAREELGVSLAWRAVRTTPDGNPADGDNFDMTSKSYRYIQRLNALRRAYFGEFGREECDAIETPDEKVPDVLVFTRGCTAERRLTLIANFHTKEDKTVRVVTPWSPGTHLLDIIPEVNASRALVGSGGVVEVRLPALGTRVFASVGGLRPVPPAVVSVSPAHGSVAQLPGAGGKLHVEVRFDQPMKPAAAAAARFDGRPGLFGCSGGDCASIVAEMPVAELRDGFHSVEVDEGVEALDGLQTFSSFRSVFTVARRRSVISDPNMHSQTGLVCHGLTRLCHHAPGADLFRARNSGGEWSKWQAVAEETPWQAQADVAVLVQYHAEGSSSYIVGDCVTAAGGRCFTSWHERMFLRGDWNGWGKDRDGAMALVGDYTWATNIDIAGFMRAKFAPGEGWSRAYGAHADRELLYNLPDYDERHKTFDIVPSMSGSEASRRYMAKGGHWSPNEALASGAEFAKELWVGAACTAEAPACPVPEDGAWHCVGFTRPEQNMDWCRAQGTVACVEYAENDKTPAMASCGPCDCCRRKVSPDLSAAARTCCVLFDDLHLNYTISSDMAKCEGLPLQVHQDARAEVVPEPECKATPPVEVVDPEVNSSLTWSLLRLAEAERSFKETGFKRMPSPETWHSEVAYSVLVDRFANGDIKNDRVNMPDVQHMELENGQPMSIATWRHGGDLLGLRQRLTYLRDLGVTIVAISPIFWNGRGDFRGSCVSDPTLVDPGFGDAQLLRDLINDAHELGLRVVLEVDVNHACGRGLQYDEDLRPERIVRCITDRADAYWNSSRGEQLFETDRSELLWGEQLHESLRHPSFFARCGPSSLYYQHGMSFDSLNSENTDPTILQAGHLWMDDSGAQQFRFNTMDPGFQQVFTNLIKYWVAYADIDGLRINSANSVAADFVAYFVTHVRHYAKTLGKDDFYVIGELDLVGDKYAPQQLGSMHGSGKLPARASSTISETCDIAQGDLPGFLASFPIPEAAHLRDIATGAEPSNFYGKQEWAQSVSSMRKLYTAARGDLQAAWNAFESKSSPRLLAKVDSQDVGDAWRLQVGLAWSLTWYGVPEIYNGVEMGFTGRCSMSPADRERTRSMLSSQGMTQKTVDHVLETCDFASGKVNSGFFQQDMFIGGPMRLGSVVPSVQEHAFIGKGLMGANGPHWCEDPLVDRSNPIYTMTRAMIRIRRSCGALRTVADAAAEIVTAPTDELAYWKVDLQHRSDSPQAMLIVLKLADAPSRSMSEYRIPEALDFREGQAFIDLLQPTRMATAVLKDGRLSLMVPDNLPSAHVAVFAPSEYAKWDDGDEWMVCSGEELPSLPQTMCRRQAEKLFLTWGGFTFVGLLIVCVLGGNARSSVFISVVREPTKPSYPASAAKREAPRHVLTAAIEHTIPERGVKVSAGGLGKVLDQMLTEHPKGVLSLVHPMFGDVDYGQLDLYKDFEVFVDGKVQAVKVYTVESERDGLRRVWYLLSHDFFDERSKKSPYPSPMTKLRTLRYFSLWNQCVALLIQELKPNVYHCMDYHAALAPLYIPKDSLTPTILVLHNADYMGVIETDFINDRFWKTVSALRRLSLVFNLKQKTIRRYLTFEGRFNMLRAGVMYLRETQAGYGVCAVSANYGVELRRERTLFSGVPVVLALDNATDAAEDHGATGIDMLKKQRFQAKKNLQAHCGLVQDPDAKILIFIGRWVKQKGVDHIAMLTPTLLRTHPEVQIILAGPPDDACGLYAQELLAPVVPEFKGRLFVCPEFFALPGDLRKGAHLCFTPSCSEPFGYVDVEFGLLGVPSVGCAIGGLGKMPGVYYRMQNADSSQMLLEAFLCSVDFALNMPDADYWEMAVAATKASFPFDTWRWNLLEAYALAIEHFRSSRRTEELSLNDLWLQNDAVEVIRNELEHRKQSAFRRKSGASIVAHQMQVLDIDDDMEFLTQAVSEERVHDIMKETMAQNERRGSLMVKDAETLQRNICLAEQRLTERNHITQWLMKPLLRTKYLRIHAVIALCYIVSPSGETLLKTTVGKSTGFLTDYMQHSIFYGGVAFGSLLWLVLSRGIPPNLLMATSQVANVLFSVLVPSLLDEALNNWTVSGFLVLSGMLSASRLLFIIWNFNEDFHGGFQVACKRIGILESCRTAVGMLAVIGNLANMEYLYQQIVLIISLTTLILLFKAPQCYCAYSLPPMGLLEGLFSRKSFILLLISELLNHAASYTSQTYHDWWVLNGWTTDDIIRFSLVIMAVSALLVPVIFMGLTRVSVWGPWPMRDFTCLLPPGSLLRALALYDLGYLHHRSYLFAAALIASYCIDIMRSAAIFGSMMAALGNKWYALKGLYMVLFLMAIVAAASPFIGREIAMAAVNASPFDRVTLDKPVSHNGSLGEVVFWAVVPLTAASYLFQVLTLRFFNEDILTFRGYGNLLADGAVTGTASSTHRVPITALKRMRRAAKKDAARPCFRPPCGRPQESEASESQSTLEDGQSEVCSQLRPPASVAASSLGPSRVCSDLVSEIEQSILFNLADRALPSRASSASHLPSAPSEVPPAAPRRARAQDCAAKRAVSEDSLSLSSVTEAQDLAALADRKFGDVCTI